MRDHHGRPLGGGPGIDLESGTMRSDQSAVVQIPQDDSQHGAAGLVVPWGLTYNPCAAGFLDVATSIRALNCRSHAATKTTQSFLCPADDDWPGGDATLNSKAATENRRCYKARGPAPRRGPQQLEPHARNH